MRICDNPDCGNEVTPDAFVWVTDHTPFRLYCSEKCYGVSE